jgi:CDGSH-type Zn-finger protein/uncharacterized Fe-S cluster protein YjdI
MSNERDPGTAPVRAPSIANAPGVDRGDRAHEFRGQDISVTWSRRRCIHAAECVMHLPTVFEPGRRPWVDVSQASEDAIARVVARCPTGALHYARTDGVLPEVAPSTNSVLVSRNGPVYLRGDIELLDESGALRLVDTRLALCRCGRSANRPLCDGSHLATGFRDAGAVRDESAVKRPGAPGGKLRVRPQRDGPLQIDGPFSLTGADRGAVVSGGSARLCRCGHSRNKPFCDGSHERTEFRSG